MLTFFSTAGLLLAILILINSIASNFNRQFLSNDTESYLFILIVTFYTASAVLTPSLFDALCFALVVLIWQYNLIKLNQQD